MKDKAGRDIRVGDLIVYGYALGRCAGLNYGKVTGVSLSPKVVKYSWEKQEEVCNFVGVQDRYNFGETPTLQKPSVLRFSERILVVERAQVPPDVLKVLAP